MTVGAALVTETVDKIIDGSLTTIEQDLMIGEDETLKPAPKIFRETCRINWNAPAKKVYDFVRGLSPYPAAWTVLHNNDKLMDVKILQTSIDKSEKPGKPGEVRTDGKKWVKVAASDGWLQILSLQLAGKKRMAVDEFLRGFKFGEKAAVE